MGEGAVFSLQGAALRVVGVKPARTGFQGTGGDGLPLRIHPGRLPVPPVPNVDSPSFHWKRRSDRVIRDKILLSDATDKSIPIKQPSGGVISGVQAPRSKQPVCFVRSKDNNS